jgi:hypothetical protein
VHQIIFVHACQDIIKLEHQYVHLAIQHVKLVPSYLIIAHLAIPIELSQIMYAIVILGLLKMQEFVHLVLPHAYLVLEQV